MRTPPSEIWVKIEPLSSWVHHWIQDLESEERKKIVLANLTDWCFGPMGGLLYAKDFQGRIYESLEDYWFRGVSDREPKPTKGELEFKDYKDFLIIKKAIINEIKKSPKDWKIEKEGDLEVVKHKSGWKHWKCLEVHCKLQGIEENGERKCKNLCNKEWKIIKKILNNKDVDLEKAYPCHELSDKKSISQPSWWEQKRNIFVVIIIIISLLFTYIIYKKRKRL